MRDNTPWADSIRSAFTDPAMQDAVDNFLTETVQPHVTRLEQQTADLKDAKALYDDLVSDPGGTYVAITRELFDDATAERVVATLEGKTAETPPTTPADETRAPALAPEDQELLNDLKAERERRAYEKAITDFKADGREDIHPNLFNPFVAGAQGDLEKAYEGYKQWLAESKSVLSPEETALDPNEVPDFPPPPVVGKGEHGATTPPPTQPRYASLNDAIDDVFNDIKAGAVPTVGSV